jgi:hypothetical protein
MLIKARTKVLNCHRSRVPLIWKPARKAIFTPIVKQKTRRKSTGFFSNLRRPLGRLRLEWGRLIGGMAHSRRKHAPAQIVARVALGAINPYAERASLRCALRTSSSHTDRCVPTP